jgi:MOSC domain-containing protein YiiM
MLFKELINNYAQAGEVTFISVRPGRKEEPKVLTEVTAIAGKGLQGDRYNAPEGSRQVTLIQHEHLPVVASLLGKTEIDITLTRRNIAVKGINLITLKGKKFAIGEAILEYTGECHPCSRMEENFGQGGYNAMRGHGGITAKIIQSGLISIKCPVTPMPE